MSENEDKCMENESVMTRRDFLRLGSASMVTLTLPVMLRKIGMPFTYKAQKTDFARKVIGKISELKPGSTIGFNYPWEHAGSANFLMMLKEEAGGGIGPDKNIVAFSSLCTHQGGPLTGQFHTDVAVAGPCPLHWTTFDLTRHGMVASGHATQGLPQIILEADGDDIVATGVLGLLYGYIDNQHDPNA